MFAKTFGNPQAVSRDLQEVDIGLIGLVLACHLIVEHYLTNFLSHNSSTFIDFDSARLTFAQKVSLVSGKNSPLTDRHVIEGIKQLNVIRNKVGHDIQATITKADVLPMQQLIDIVAEDAKVGKRDLDPIEAIQLFTYMVCGYIAGYCTAKVDVKKGDTAHQP
jgi:hypothetical protein